MRRLWILVFVLLAACAPAATSAPRQSYPSIAATSAPAATGAPMATAAGVMLTAYPASVPGSPAQLAFAPAGSGMVVKNAQMDLLVADTDRFIDHTTQMLSTEGGYLISSQTWLTDGFKYATLEMGIPSGRFEAVLTRVRGQALQVIRENATGQDVSAAYVDLGSRLTNLEATAARVRDFLKDAQTTEDSLRINQQLSDLEAQIEQVKGQMRYYEGRSAYSTLTLNLTPQQPTPQPTLTPTPTPRVKWDPGKTFDQASGMLVDSAQTLADGLIWLIVGLGPYLLALALIVLVVRRLFRRSAGK
jgi:hypothetical protein